MNINDIKFEELTPYEKAQLFMKKAIENYKLAVEQGDVKAQYELGCHYYNGVGVELDYKEAVRLYTLAAEQGHSQAQLHLSNCYDQGIGIEKDEEEAKKWLDLSEINTK